MVESHCNLELFWTNNVSTILISMPVCRIMNYHALLLMAMGMFSADLLMLLHEYLFCFPGYFCSVLFPKLYFDVLFQKPRVCLFAALEVQSACMKIKSIQIFAGQHRF